MKQPIVHVQVGLAAEFAVTMSTFERLLFLLIIAMNLSTMSEQIGLRIGHKIAHFTLNRRVNVLDVGIEIALGSGGEVAMRAFEGSFVVMNSVDVDFEISFLVGSVTALSTFELLLLLLGRSLVDEGQRLAIVHVQVTFAEGHKSLFAENAAVFPLIIWFISIYFRL